MSHDCNHKLKVPDILAKIKELGDGNRKTYFYGMDIDYTFTLSEGCPPHTIEKLEQAYGNKLPAEYKTFLSITDGLKLSRYVGSYLFSIEEIYQAREVYTGEFNLYPPNILIIGSCYDSAFNVAIDLNADHNDNMYIHEVMPSSRLYSLNCGFTDFLDRFALTYGSLFWEWGCVKSKYIDV